MGSGKNGPHTRHAVDHAEKEQKQENADVTNHDIGVEIVQGVKKMYKNVLKRLSARVTYFSVLSLTFLY